MNIQPFHEPPSLIVCFARDQSIRYNIFGLRLYISEWDIFRIPNTLKDVLTKGGYHMTQSIEQKSTLAQIIRERRAVKTGYTDKEVTKEVVLELLNDAIWAPTHGMRQPWRFIFVSNQQKADFAKKIAATYPEDMRENREAFLNEPNAYLIVVMEEPDNQKQWDENFGATAAMIQNFWLLAWERNLGVVWRTNPHIYDPKVKEILNIGENEKIVGFLHLGYFDEPPMKKDRIPAEEKFTEYQGS